MNSSTDYAAALLGKARDDGYVVRRMSADAAAPNWVIGFHAQQAVEKSIKSVLTRHEIEFPRTHNLSMPRESCIPDFRHLGQAMESRRWLDGLGK